MSEHIVPLSPTELAYVAMVQEEFTQAEAFATTRRQERLDVVRRDKGVPDGVNVTIDGGVLRYPSIDVRTDARPGEVPT